MNKHTPAPFDPEQRDGPSLFVGVSFPANQLTVDALAIQGHRLMSNVRAMNEGMQNSAAVNVKLALENIAADCDEIQKISAGMRSLAKRTAEIIADHLKRKPRA